jgi:hypothetical protein
MLARGLIAVLVALLLVSVQPPVAEACSGGGPIPNYVSLERMLEWSDYFIKAEVLRTDDSQQNHLLRPIYSFKGIPPGLLLNINLNTSTIRLKQHYGYPACVGFDRTLPAQAGDIAFFALRRVANGSYETLLSGELLLSRFDHDSTVYVRVDPSLPDDAANNLKQTPVRDESNFIQLVQERGGLPPTSDGIVFPEAPILIFEPILLTTETGNRFMLPVDLQEVVPIPPDELPATIGMRHEEQCFVNQCLLFSPDMTSQIRRISDDRMYFSGLDGYCDSNMPPDCYVLAGQAARYSPDSQWLAIWNWDALLIYDITRRIGEYNWPSYVPAMREVARIPLHLGDSISSEVVSGWGVWSQDSRVFVFSDAMGLWWFDLYQQMEPRLLIPRMSESPFLPIELSHEGRFLAYSPEGNRQRWLLRDLISGIEYPNLLLAPDNRTGVALNAEGLSYTSGSPFRVNSLSFPIGGSWELQWLSNTDFAFTVCDERAGNCRLDYCGHSSVNPIPLSLDCWSYLQDNLAYDIDFALQAGGISVLLDQKTVQATMPGGISLQPAVDGKIVSVEWMLPLFYFEPE